MKIVFEIEYPDEDIAEAFQYQPGEQSLEEYVTQGYSQSVKNQMDAFLKARHLDNALNKTI